ncbi:hypothetical protein HW932_20070 [Allochromatium humboldtianum]|uniref:Uncharacterized protein n=1 Tax=Allochromatium humboldtianum TaxID=504901 RepID=A0A850R9Y3_9GAMM|nr:hypothetical protein [Allochromatium humboldtianum]NVZ11549.1 hypothetical protein [Allochromatium humboldtianum]
MTQEIQLAAEVWEECRKAYSAHRFLEQQSKDKPCGVATFEYQGYLYTVFGVCHGPYGNPVWGRIMAYRLVPEATFNGETTFVYHDEDAIAAGRRARGDHTGLIVLVKGTRMVCEKAVSFRRGLPTTRPISRQEAERHEQQSQGMGWRAHFWKGIHPSWKSLQGHPVALYEKQEERLAMLLWKHGRHVEELPLSDDLELDPLESVSSALNDEALIQRRQPMARVPMEQLALF